METVCDHSTNLRRRATRMAVPNERCRCFATCFFLKRRSSDGSWKFPNEDFSFPNCSTKVQGSAFVKDFDKRSRNLNELANERAFVFVFVFVKDGQPTSVSVKGYQGVSDWRVR